MEPTQANQRLDANIVVSCDQELFETVEALAASEDRTRAAMARLLIKEAVAARNQKPNRRRQTAQA